MTHGVARKKILRCAQEDARTHTDTNAPLSPLLKRGKRTETPQRAEIEGSIQGSGIQMQNFD